MFRDEGLSVFDEHSSDGSDLLSPLKEWRECGFSALCIFFAVFMLVTWKFAADIRPWIELLNGATWPTDWNSLYNSHSVIFSIVLAVRAVVNLSVVPAIVFVGIEFFALSRRRVVKLHQLLAIRERAVLRAISVTLDVNDEQRDKMFQAANVAAQNWDAENLPSIVGQKAANQLMDIEVRTARESGASTPTSRGI